MDRRSFLSSFGAAGLILPGIAGSADAQKIALNSAGLRGSLDASQFGVRPDAHDDQSKLLQRVLDQACSSKTG